jgi:tight adherence protein C
VVEAADLLAVAARAGHNPRLALEAVTPRLSGPVAEALSGALARSGHGSRLADALDAAGSAIGDQGRALTSVLAASERYGSLLAPALDRLAGELRSQLRRQAEAEARKLPVKLLFPLVLCVLPAFGLLTLAPLVAGALDALSL